MQPDGVSALTAMKLSMPMAAALRIWPLVFRLHSRVSSRAPSVAV
ncbi:Uncharacterised protein [Mycobacteroides abscessus subsp. abscessus]|nr:Uncharacterised protein [Mycobacteroides abscessus subsp. abscessus]